MNESSSDDLLLDVALQDWSRRNAADKETLDRLHRRIVQNSLPFLEPVHANASPSRALLSKCAVFMCAVSTSAIAAAVALAVLWNPGLDSRSVTRRASSAGVAAPTKLASLWGETSRLFGTDLEWIGDLDGEFLLGIHHVEHSAESTRIGLSLSMREFDPARRAWVETWAGRFVCRGGSVVDFTSSDQQSSGSIWVQSRPDGRFAVSHWMTWRDHPDLSGAIEATVRPGQSEVVSEAIVEGRRIQVVQHVWRADLG